jgi:hypothetical protein
MEENYTIPKEARMFSPHDLLQAFRDGAVPVGVNCTSMFKEVYQHYT